MGDEVLHIAMQSRPDLLPLPHTHLCPTCFDHAECRQMCAGFEGQGTANGLRLGSPAECDACKASKERKCEDCGEVTIADACFGCGKLVCQRCAEGEGRFCRCFDENGNERACASCELFTRKTDDDHQGWCSLRTTLGDMVRDIEACRQWRPHTAKETPR